MLITDYAGTLLRGEMDWVPMWRGNHVSIKELADFFARYVYLPRLKNTDVLFEAIQKGVGSKRPSPMPSVGMPNTIATWA